MTNTKHEALQAIDLFLTYRNEHGLTDEQAREHAVADIQKATADVPVGICGARLHYVSTYDGANVLCVCTKAPGHVQAGDAEHEDETRGGAPKAKWENPTW
ncbi:hypothetical protein [Blastococcus xanthinilyticus]|uniref:Uncharacterized protein n=1 Tax=Blastococcus xanthinilyticus TaxID=1564164 RepID=A0A5S5CMD1_9ACTN|nr:hypothetical protein [Blastococcus xanthinilyticus]TYP80449.1 hypothetical protein BD833_1333 [Blastococcus xanthinilyticus]